jgi:hypothetical protein
MAYLFHAEPCDGTDGDPFSRDGHPGVRVKCGEAIVGRLSTREAIALARDLLTVAMPPEKDIR